MYTLREPSYERFRLASINHASEEAENIVGGMIFRLFRLAVDLAVVEKKSVVSMVFYGNESGTLSLS